MKHLNILVSAYACRPGEGSEPNIGWNFIKEVVKYHQIWLITRANNRPSLEAELQANPLPGLQIIYCDLPQWVQFLNKGQKIVQLHYYLWQVAAYLKARQLHPQINFDLIHHVTYVKYWSPSFLALLPVPFIWGPVGGGESTPTSFLANLGVRGKIYEGLRNAVRQLSELDPFVQLTAKRSFLAWGTTSDTAERLQKLGATQVKVMSQLGLASKEITDLATLSQPYPQSFRLISIGRLLHWKGFHLGLQAFAQADLPPNAQYWIIGEGAERKQLEILAQKLEISHQVKFLGKLSRQETLKKLGQCSVLVHPSLHDSGGLVCLEAMAMQRPVICLDLGGPAVQVTEETGIKIPAQFPEQTTQGLAEAMTRLSQDRVLIRRLGKAGRERLETVYSWQLKIHLYLKEYENVSLKV